MVPPKSEFAVFSNCAYIKLVDSSHLLEGGGGAGAGGGAEAADEDNVEGNSRSIRESYVRMGVPQTHRQAAEEDIYEPMPM